MRKPLLAILLLALAASASAKGSDVSDSLAARLETLRAETAALRELRREKLDALERAETRRWSERYAANARREEAAAKARSLEGRYAKLSADLGRLQTELLDLRGAGEELRERAESRKAALEAFAVQAATAAEKELDAVAGDFPAGMESRMLRLRRSAAALRGGDLLGGLDLFFADRLERHAATLTREWNPRDELGPTLRAGTVFLGRRAAAGPEAVTRTGALRGKVFEWNSALSPSYAAMVEEAVAGAGTSAATLRIPVDLLQNKAMRNVAASAEPGEAGARLAAWFRSGGVVMYPLAFVALLALLLCLDRFVAFARHGRVSRKFLRAFDERVAAGDFEAAAALCVRENSCLSRVLLSLVRDPGKDYASAEKLLNEAMMTERPRLEKRMGLIASLGSIAPLLGLLGTVTGIIALFQTITSAGTNDARILAGGISEALVTTETGLIVAIPVMVLHGLLSERLDRIAGAISTRASELLNRLYMGR